MESIVGPLKAYLKKSDPAVIDNFSFKLHYRATFVVLLVSMMLVSAGQFLGNPINCIADGVPGGAMDLYCWIHSTFSVPSRWGKIGEEYGVGGPDEIGRHNPHPGIAPLVPGEEVIYHKYYQWVVFVLFIQAVMFHLPRIVWKHSEGGLMKTLVGDLTNPIYVVKKDERLDQVMKIRKYFKDGGRTHGGYAMHYFLCEVLALVNILGQIYLTDRFLGYQFTTYGFDVVSGTVGNSEGTADPMNVVFPKMTKCTFHKYGPSGTITTHDGLCILALNIINEKIYVFLWFWFLGVALYSITAILYRIIILASHSIRVRVIMKRIHQTVNKNIVEDILSCPHHSWVDKIGDYWVIYLLSKNLSPVAMKELLEELKPILNPAPQYGYSKLDNDTQL